MVSIQELFSLIKKGFQVLLFLKPFFYQRLKLLVLSAPALCIVLLVAGAVQLAVQLLDLRAQPVAALLKIALDAAAFVGVFGVAQLALLVLVGLGQFALFVVDGVVSENGK